MGTVSEDRETLPLADSDDLVGAGRGQAVDPSRQRWRDPQHLTVRIGDDLDVHAAATVPSRVVGTGVTDAVALGTGAVQKDELGIVPAQRLEKTRSAVGEQSGHGGDVVAGGADGYSEAGHEPDEHVMATQVHQRDELHGPSPGTCATERQKPSCENTYTTNRVPSASASGGTRNVDADRRDMASAKALVRVLDHGTEVESELCRPIRLTPDGYAGVAYAARLPTPAGDLIDLDGSSWELADCDRFLFTGAEVPYVPLAVNRWRRSGSGFTRPRLPQPSEQMRHGPGTNPPSFLTAPAALCIGVCRTAATFSCSTGLQRDRKSVV